MVVTDDVSKLLKSNVIKFLQPLNIECIVLTDDVLKLLKSNDIKFPQ